VGRLADCPRSIRDFGTAHPGAGMPLNRGLQGRNALAPAAEGEPAGEGKAEEGGDGGGLGDGGDELEAFVAFEIGEADGVEVGIASVSFTTSPAGFTDLDRIEVAKQGRGGGEERSAQFGHGAWDEVGLAEDPDIEGVGLGVPLDDKEIGGVLKKGRAGGGRGPFPVAKSGGASGLNGGAQDGIPVVKSVVVNGDRGAIGRCGLRDIPWNVLTEGHHRETIFDSGSPAVEAAVPELTGDGLPEVMGNTPGKVCLGAPRPGVLIAGLGVAGVVEGEIYIPGKPHAVRVGRPVRGGLKAAFIPVKIIRIEVLGEGDLCRQQSRNQQSWGKQRQR